MSTIKVLFAFLLLVLSVGDVTAMHNTRLFNDRSLVSSNYSSFCLDSDGSLWIGTQSGLLRFDGTSFDKYLHDDRSETSLSDNRIIKIIRDETDRIWVATCEGLNLYNPDSDSFTRISLPNKTLKGYISDIMQQSNGDIFFMVAGVGLYVLDFSSGEPVAVRNMPLEQEMLGINTLAESPNGELLGGTHNGDVIRIAANGQIRMYHPASSYIKILLPDGNKNIFVTTNDKAWIWNTTTDVFEEVAIARNPVLHSATVTHDGDILVGTVGGGLYELKKGDRKLTRYSECRNPLVNIDRARISTLYEDPRKNLWLGCSHQGILMAPADGLPFNFMSLENILPNYSGGTTVVCTVPGDETIWVGIDDGRLANIDRYSRLLHSKNFGGAISSILYSPRHKRIYIGVDNHGLYEVDPVTLSTRQILNVPGRYIARPVIEDKNGDIYLGIHGRGVMKVNPSTLATEQLKENNDISSLRWTSSLLCDSRGRIWIGMFGALAVYDVDSKQLTSISAKYPQLNKGVHNAIAEGPDGKIWDATSYGLFIIDPDNFTHSRLTTNEGLSDILLSSIVFDKDGNAWVGTHDGINRIDSRRNITVFRANDNMADIDYASAATAGDGVNLLFGGNNGLTLFNPRTLKTPTMDYETYISGYYLNGEKVTRESRTLAGNKQILSGDEHINLSYKENPLTLRMSTRDFRTTDNLIYQWRIPGIVNDWVSTSPGSNYITLPHFQSGKVHLQIRAGENGEFSKVKTITISVTPPWYLTLPVKIFFCALICVLITLAVIVLRKKNTERINEEKIKFFINVSHEIRSPLTLILGPLERIMKKDHDAETAKNLNAIHRNANRILALINQLLDIRKIDKGKMEIERSETELISFTRDLVEIFQTQAEEKRQKLSFSTSSPDLTQLNVWIDRNNFDKVLVNLLSNAIKYTPAGGDINVNVTTGIDTTIGDYAEITVTDTGIGLDEKNIHRIFDRFYQGKFNKGEMPLGFGIGLDLCRQLVELHGGTISASNRTDTKGSRFTVRIPYRQARSTATDAHHEAAVPQGEHSRAIKFEPKLASTSIPDTKRPRKASSVKILVVDDDPEIRAYLSDVLSTTGQVTEASDGKEAMRSVTNSAPDLIISDVVMPEMDGLHLLKTLKSNVGTNHIPVILLSSKNDVADRMAGWDKGADGYIGKPFNINELLALVDSLIDNRLRLKGKFSGIQQQDSNIDTPILKGNDKALIDKIVQEINDHLDDPDLNVEKLCQQVGLSRAHLNRRMKELFGLTPSEFIRNIRLRKACELLRRNDIDISQIAYSVGFTSQPHFSTAFKRFTGFSPSDYRTNNPVDNAES